ncbi:MAG TPA: DUF1854 domain-containing protein [Pirellulales bacterium]
MIDSTHDASPPPADCDLSQDVWGRLVFTDAAGTQHVGVAPVRAFPITDPTHWVSICDAHGGELACYPDLAEVPPRMRELIEAELSRRDFIPAIRRIVKIASTVEPTEWIVETDRGTTSFTLDSEEHVRRLGAHQATVTDSHGMRYLIADLRALDAASRRMLERYL